MHFHFQASYSPIQGRSLPAPHRPPPCTEPASREASVLWHPGATRSKWT